MIELKSLGCRQVVRHRVLVPTFVGSSPTTPAMVCMENKVFDRIEKKYLITESDKNILLLAINQNMEHDNYYQSEVLNIYFDNDNYDLITQSVDWTDFKEKIRARSYDGYDRVFLEIKTKIHRPENNIGYKRRVMITHDDFNELIKNQKTAVELASKTIENENDLQIAKEVDYLITTLHLKPKILITYNRESYKDDNGLRITFDENLKYRDKNVSFNESESDKIYFKDNRNIIMEIKAHGAMPLWLVKLMSELKIYPQQFSKIGKVYQKLKGV